MIADTGRREIFIKEVLELVVCWHLVTLAALLLQPHPPTLAIGKIVFALCIATTALMRAKARSAEHMATELARGIGSPALELKDERLPVGQG